MNKDKELVCIEICIDKLWNIAKEELKNKVVSMLNEFTNIFSGIIYGSDISADKLQLKQHNIYFMKIYFVFSNAKEIKITESIFNICIWRKQKTEVIEESICCDDNDYIRVGLRKQVPCIEYEELFEILYFDCNIKNLILQYIDKYIKFNQINVNKNIINYGGIILLHGPPGTGKSTLMKGISHKISIRIINCSKYKNVEIFEIKSEWILSKWHGESAKNIDKIINIIKNNNNSQENIFNIIIFDEIESFVGCRKSNMNKLLDAKRVVNTMLIKLDEINKCKNVIVLCSTNLPLINDNAFIDRVDLLINIGLPSEQSIYKILKSCLEELIIKNMILIESNIDKKIIFYDEYKDNMDMDNHDLNYSQKLFHISRLCNGLSGRELRKIPFLVHMNDIGLNINDHNKSGKCYLNKYLDLLKLQVIKQQKQKQLFFEKKSHK